MEPERERKLTKLYHDLISGKSHIEHRQTAKLFLSAVDFICRQKGPSHCVQTLVGSRTGIEAVSTAVRSDVSIEGVVSTLRLFIRHILSSEVAVIGGGQFLQQLLTAVLSPPVFWNALLAAHESCHELKGGEEEEKDMGTFAQLCLAIVTAQCPELDGPCQHVQKLIRGKTLLESSSHPVRQVAYRIQKVVQLMSTTSVKTTNLDDGPGGRHDNDFTDFRQIAIYPTLDEIQSKKEPFLQRLKDVFDGPKESRARDHRDWLFRLLREDMLSGLKEDLLIATGEKKKSRKSPISLRRLTLIDTFNDDGPRQPLTLAVKCREGITFPSNVKSETDKKKYLKDNRSFLPHQSFGALCYGQDVVTFGFLLRDFDLLCQSPPAIAIQFIDASGLRNALQALLGPRIEKLIFVVVDTPTFAYQPILQRLKEISFNPIEDSFLFPVDEGSDECSLPESLRTVVDLFKDAIDADEDVSLSTVVSMPNSLVVIGGAQLQSLVSGLDSTIGLIQGPPGTGKSFVGALIVLLILQLTRYRVLVLSYTNHALDQFLVDLKNVGVDDATMVRLGSKAPSMNAEKMHISHLSPQQEFRPCRRIFQHRQKLSRDIFQAREAMSRLRTLLTHRCSANCILELLQFSDEAAPFLFAFHISDDADGYRIVGISNRYLKPAAVYNIWLNCEENSGYYRRLKHLIPSRGQFAWNLSKISRHQLHEAWQRQSHKQHLDDYVEAAERHAQLERERGSLEDESKRNVVRSRRVIGCTTTGASIHQSIITAAQPDFVLVEEAGEILEAHVVAALGPSVKQLCLIGDHKQLRPKVSNYKLTVEKGEGFDLNVSLFERLIRQGHPFTTLNEQHRAHPDISHFTRLLAYEGLEDGAKTLTRPEVRGLRTRVTFVHHEKSEDRWIDGTDRQEKTSKRNKFEADMVLKTVKYLGQQGYSPKNLVILTPYLGQLFLLQRELGQSHDPYLNDLDHAELLRAGLIEPAAAAVKKTPLRLSTIDNYQGEESDIVIVSMTRSNPDGDIGFLYSRERLVVLMSRAREGIILFGNMHTFMKSKKGGDLWTRFFEELKARGCIFDGLPVYCERHPQRSLLLKTAKDFDQHCPDGGCAELCNAMLGCGKHSCSLRCHRLVDHTKMACGHLVEKTCDRGHKSFVACGDNNPGCQACAVEDETTKRRLKRDWDLEMKRKKQQDAYLRELQEVEDEIYHHRKVMKTEAERKEQGETLSQKQGQLQGLKETKAKMDEAKDKRVNKPDMATVQDSRENDIGPMEQEWEMMKDEGACNQAIDKLMGMIGLESVKEEFLSLKSTIDTKIRQGLPLSKERLGCVLLGNPGTGKTTVARHWASFLTSVGAIPGDSFVETTGAKLAAGGVAAATTMLEKIKDEGGGVIFIDESYCLASGNSPGGKGVLDYLLAEVENLRGKVSFVLAGYRREMEPFFAHNPGLTSRFPIEMTFEDYTDLELEQILRSKIREKWEGRMKVEEGTNGLFVRIVSRRIGRGRGRDGFGNARAVENALASIEKRQAKRLRLLRRAGRSSDDFLLTKEDVIGPEPTTTLKQCQAWTKLSDMIGLEKVKDEMKVLMDSLTTNYQREVAEEPLLEFALNRVFLGSPGTGKTTVAKLYGRILADLGFLSNGEVVVKTPADFIGSALGQSEAQTKGILAATTGKVLVIDEAYGLCGGGGSTADPYRAAVVDTIVAEVQNVPGEDRCVILVGYEEQMEEMFQRVNPGLARRFQIDSPVLFEDFDNEQLSRIIDLKLKASGFASTSRGKRVALEVLARERNRPNFGNGGAVENLLTKAKSGYQKRCSAGKAKKNLLDATDFDEDFDRAESIGADVSLLFRDDIGRDKLITMLQELQNRVKMLKSLGMDPATEVPFSFLFRGPPGTGKTSTARKIGQVYYDLGILAGTTVVECSASDLIAQFIGQTGPKVRKMMDRALGQVLFIDEAYRLRGGFFAQEAVDELVDGMTKPRYQGKMIIILAGYVEDINDLLSVNRGMSSRFPQTIDFEALRGQECVDLLAKALGKRKVEMEGRGKKVDISCIESPSNDFRASIVARFQRLSRVEGWGNARDVLQLAKSMFRRIDLASDEARLDEGLVREDLDKMLEERVGRERQRGMRVSNRTEEMAQDKTFALPSMSTTKMTTTTSRAPEVRMDEKDEEDEVDDEAEEAEDSCPVRDAGVTDDVWDQLQLDKAEEERRMMECRKLAEAQKAARGAARRQVMQQLQAAMEREEQEKAAKAKLKQLGACPVGFEWIRQEGGYRCAGGSHWMGDGQLKQL